MATNREYLFKVLVVGDSGAGKTSIIKRYVHNIFSSQYKTTIGVDFALKVLTRGEAIVRLQLWDIAGQERFGSMTRVYYKEAVGAFAVFDVTRIATFHSIAKWKRDIDSKVFLPNGKPIPVVLLANKCDLSKEGMVKNASQMADYCKEHGFVDWFETSAKDNVGISDAADCLVDAIIKAVQSGAAPEPEPPKPSDVVTLRDPQEKTKKPSISAAEEKSGCC